MIPGSALAGLHGMLQCSKNPWRKSDCIVAVQIWKWNLMKKIVMMLLLTGMLTAGSVGRAIQVQGKKEMVLDGGRLGKVPFPHHTHQTVLDDCNRCHRLFPQTSGAIQQLISQKSLLARQVMNQCRNCHKEKVKSGEKAGPVKCTECHIKN